MNTVLRATDSAEFLGLVPALAGFTPRQSIVLLPFQRSRAHGAMRIDLPRDDVDLDDYVDRAIGLLSQVSGTDAVAVVVYTDEAPQHTPDGIVLPSSVVVDELLGLSEDLGMHIVDALCVTLEGWASYLHDEPILRPLDEIPAPPSIPGLADVAGDQDYGAALPVVDLAEKERVGRALLGISDLLAHDHVELSDRARTNPQAIAACVVLEDLPLFFEDLLDSPENLPPFATAALLWCMERPRYRDVALLQWATDLPTGERALTAQLAYAEGAAAVPDDLGEVFLGRGPRPDADRLRVALTIARGAAARAPRASRSAPLTAAAWLSWALGRSSHAAHYLRLVSEIDPGYSLACLIGSMIDAALLPEWTFHRGEAIEE
ncbi:DUF4192 family protein [Microbacterium sp.]|uniref:DUF4192 family protein n=1 Tax=Microbacterium sp. TaxID=51671 RepID=UPI0027360A32|nr:DUF4192 family protein [Microbacterium sp.]MDP3952343.1 DUF4192 family protein [Microbacterium sp.]